MKENMSDKFLRQSLFSDSRTRKSLVGQIVDIQYQDWMNVQ